MTEKKDESLGDLKDAVELIDLGDALEETKQVAPVVRWPDCTFGYGVKWGGC